MTLLPVALGVLGVFLLTRKGAPFSKYFTLADFTRSSTAEREKIPNIPNAEAKANMRRMAQTVLDPLWDEIGPFMITSGYRSPALNAAIPGSASNSPHLYGKAVDIESPTHSAYQVMNAIKAAKLPHASMLPYADGHVHLSIG